MERTRRGLHCRVIGRPGADATDDVTVATVRKLVQANPRECLHPEQIGQERDRVASPDEPFMDDHVRGFEANLRHESGRVADPVGPLACSTACWLHHPVGVGQVHDSFGIGER